MARRTRATRMGIGIDGLEEALQMLKNVDAQGLDALDKASKAGAEIVEAEAKRRVPVRTEALKKSIQVTRKENSRTRSKKKIVYQIGPTYKSRKNKDGINYGHFVEFGTSKTPAQPYMRPAVDENFTKIRETMADTIARNIKG